MKRRSIIFTVLMLGVLSACTQGSPGATVREGCNDYGCVTISIEGPVQAMQPAKIQISVKSTQNTEELWVSLTAYGLDSIYFEKLPEGTKTALEKEKHMGFSWILPNVEANKEYIFEGSVVLVEPPNKMGMHTYRFFVGASYIRSGPILANANIFLDDDGSQMDQELVKDFLETEVEILPNETDFIIFPTDTPNPTIRIPTDTPLPTSKSTVPAYPPPGENSGAGDSAPIPTQAGYPAP